MTADLRGRIASLPSILQVVWVKGTTSAGVLVVVSALLVSSLTALWSPMIVTGQGRAEVGDRDIGGWGPPASIRTPTSRGIAGWDIVVDANGEATAAWIEFDDQRPREFTVWASRWPTNEGWTSPARIGGPFCCGSFFLRLEVGLQGHVVAVWNQIAGDEDGFWMNTLGPGLPWGVPESIPEEIPQGYWVTMPFSFAVDGTGRFPEPLLQ